MKSKRLKVLLRQSFRKQVPFKQDIFITNFKERKTYFIFQIGHKDMYTDAIIRFDKFEQDVERLIQSMKFNKFIK